MTFYTPISPHSHVHAASDLGTHQLRDVVCLDDVSFAYDGKAALSHITLHVKESGTLGIIGPNGGGKSTLLKLMLGLLRPDAGTVTVLGLPPGEACADGRLVGYVPQRHQIDWSFPITVRQVVQLGLIKRKRRFGFFTRAHRRRVEEALAAVDMAASAEEPIGSLSGGQQQRVFIARALVNEPRLLFLDEPATGIDQGGQEKLAGLLDTVRRAFGLTIVMVSHDIRTVMASCDQVACLNRTLHYHDCPAGLSREILFRVFQCDLDAVLDPHTPPHTPDAACQQAHGAEFSPAPFRPPGV